MPYAPGSSYSGDRYIAQGKSNLIQAIMTLVGGISAQNDQAKQLRTTLSEYDPENSDRYKKMGLNELQGEFQAKEMSAKRDAASLLAQEARQRIASGLAAQKNQAQVGPFFQAWQQNLDPSAPMTSGGAPAAGPAAPGMSPLQAALSAAGQYPGGAEASGFGHSLPAILRAMSTSGGGANAPAVVPFTLGEGDNQLSGGVDTKTGKPILDPDTTRRLNSWRQPAVRSGAAPTLPKGGKRVQARDGEGKPIPGLYDILDAQGNYHSSWSNPHPAAKSGGLSLFGDQAGTGTGAGSAYQTTDDVKKAYQAGKLSYDAAAQVLQEQFKIGVAPAAAASGDEEEE